MRTVLVGFAGITAEFIEQKELCIDFCLHYFMIAIYHEGLYADLSGT